MRAARDVRSLLVLTLFAAVPVVATAAEPASAATLPTALTPNGGTTRVVFRNAGAVRTIRVMGLAGQQLTIATSHGTLPSNCDVHLRLRAPDSSLIAGPVCAGHHGNVSVASLPADGSYRASLTSSAMGSLTIAAKSSGGPRSITPGAAPLKVSWPVQTNQDIQLGFTADEGDIFSIVATGGNGNQPCLLSVGFVDSNDDPVGTTGVQCAAGGAFIRRTTVPAAGTYFVRLLGYDSKPLFVQLFHVVDQVIPVATDGTPAPFDTPTPGQDARFTFSATAGQNASAVLSSTWAPFTEILLLRPDGSPFWSNQETGFLESPKTKTLDQTGTWTIVVERNNPEPDSGTLRVYVFDDITATADLSGTPHDLSLVPGQRAIYSFSGTSGQKISALLTKIKPGPCGALKHLLTLVRPDDSVAADSTCIDKNKFLDATTLDVTGTWKVVVDPEGAAAPSATLQIFDVVDQTGAVATDGTPAAITISQPGQNARFSFTAPNAHQTVTVSITGATPPSCKLQLLKAGVLVSETTCSLGSATIGPMVIGNGSYDVLFDPQGPATGSASLTVTFGA
jgi:hypothetical protein